MSDRRHSAYVARRPLLTWAAVVAVAAAAVFGGWGAFSAIRASSELESASRELAAYQEARKFVREHRAAVARQAFDPSRADAAIITRAGAATREALAAAEGETPAGDEPFTSSVLRSHQHYANAVAGVLAHARAGRLARARQVDSEQVQPAAELLEGKLAAAVVHARARALREAAAERRLERLALATAPLLLALTLLSGFVSAKFGRRRRSERVALRRMTEAAFTDSLTGLGNRRAFDEEAKRLIRDRSTSGKALSLMLLDLDGLKQINDTLGHHAGDERIKEVGRLLRAVLRESDSAYRTGGDEFIVLLPGERAWGALSVAQRLHELAAEGRSSVTVGVAETIGLESKETLVWHADLALYEAKRSRRRVVVYSSELEVGPRVTEVRTDEGHTALVATALARAVDAKDAATSAHCETVSELSALVAHELGLDAEHVGRVRLAGLLHDVGKIGIPDAVLRKEAPLDPAEGDVIRTHPVVGESIVESAGLPEEARWIRHHHERLDGTGYPDRLGVEAIPLESRIIFVADVFEAITADRPYRKARSADEALAELERNAGTWFDPSCVAAVRRIVLGDAQLAA